MWAPRREGFLKDGLRRRTMAIAFGGNGNWTRDILGILRVSSRMLRGEEET